MRQTDPQPIDSWTPLCTYSPIVRITDCQQQLVDSFHGEAGYFVLYYTVMYYTA